MFLLEDRMFKMEAKRKAGMRVILGVMALGLMAGCASAKKNDVVSGSPAADERASEIVSDKGKGKRDEDKGGTNAVTLYQRLGGEPGIQRIVDDFVDRALEDPRVNWSRN